MSDVELPVSSYYSVLFEEAFNIGVQKVKCIDYCFDLIEFLKKKHEATHGTHVEFICCDARKMQDYFKEPCFDTVFDKGTFDCIMVGVKSKGGRCFDGPSFEVFGRDFKSHGS